MSWDDAANATGYDVYLIQAPWGWGDIKYSQHIDTPYHYCKFNNVVPGYYNAFVVSRPNDNDAQSEWKNFQIDKPIQIEPSEGVYIIHSAWDDNQVLDIQYDSVENRANIQLYHKVNSDVQKFRIIKYGDYYCIQSVYSGKWLDIA